MLQLLCLHFPFVFRFNEYYCLAALAPQLAGETLQQGLDAAFDIRSESNRAYALAALAMEWTYFEVKKSVGDAKVIQYERLLGEVTSHLMTKYILVPRKGPKSRFLPVKDFDELARRSGELEELALDRGMLGAT